VVQVHRVHQAQLAAAVEFAAVDDRYTTVAGRMDVVGEVRYWTYDVVEEVATVVVAVSAAPAAVARVAS
jgi:hypothetical protein